MLGFRKRYYIKVEKPNTGIPTSYIEYMSSSEIGYTTNKKLAKKYDTEEAASKDIKLVEVDLYGKGYIISLCS